MARYSTLILTAALPMLMTAGAEAQMTADWPDQSHASDDHTQHNHQIDDIVEPDYPLTARPAVSYLRGTANDSDGDGLTELQELALGTDPNDIDSDCDSVDDGSEVVSAASPADGDSDGIIDALENRFADSDGDNLNDQDDPTSGWQPSCGQFYPFAIASDSTDSTRIEVRIAGGSNVSGVIVRGSQAVNSVQLDGANIGTTGIALFDDGSNGDRRAGDNIWTRDGITSNAFVNTVATQTFNQIEVTDNGGTSSKDLDGVIGSFGRFRLGIVRADTVVTPQVVGADSQIASHLVNMISPLGMLGVKQFLNSSFGDSSLLRGATQLFYSIFDDSYDFLALFPESASQRGASGVTSPVSNNVSGIGLPVFDNTAAWGSNGKLQAVVTRNMGDNGPTLHEFMHRWGAYLDPALGFSQCTGGHWGIAGVGYGQLGGFDPATLVANGDGTFTLDAFGAFANGGDSVDYAPIERYLMGLANTATVGSMTVPVNADCSFGFNGLDCNFGNNTCTFKADGVTTVTIDDIIATEGARNPSFATSQKAFSAAFIVFSQYPLNGAEMAYYNNQAILFGNSSGNGFIKSFQEATLNQGTMDTSIGIPLPNQIFSDQFE